MIFGLSPEAIRERLRTGEVTVAVYGLGRIGLPIAVAWLRASAKVIGSDVDQKIIQKINSGTSLVLDQPGIPEAIQTYVSNGRLRATKDLVQASKLSEIKIIMVPTASTDEKKFNAIMLKKALLAIGKGLKKGDVVIIECSVPPTTTEKVARPILELHSGLEAERDFALAFSPERVMAGRALKDLEEITQKSWGV